MSHFQKLQYDARRKRETSQLNEKEVYEEKKLKFMQDLANTL